MFFRGIAKGLFLEMLLGRFHVSHDFFNTSPERVPNPLQHLQINARRLMLTLWRMARRVLATCRRNSDQWAISCDLCQK
jgi:hypothetical protein